MIGKLGFQIAALVEGPSNILEFLDEAEDAIMAVSIDEADRYYLTFYRSEKTVCIPLSEVEKGISLAKEKIKNLDIDPE